MSARKLKLFLVLFAAFGIIHSCQAGPISGTGTKGSYTGSFNYAASDSANAVLTVELTNTSPAGNGGFLTAFAFNLPTKSIDSVTFSAPGTNFGLIGDFATLDSVNGGPFGQFDLGASTGASFEGGGAPSQGLGVGVSGTFFFTFTGSDLNLLTTADFLNELSVGPGDGEGNKSFVARFRGFVDGSSDKVPGTPGTPPGDVIITDVPQAPEPATLTLALIGGAGMLGWRWRRTKVA